MNRRRERRTLWWAVVASFFVHIVVALSLASFNTAFAPPPLDEEKPAELTLVDLPSLPSAPVKPNPAYIDTDKEAPEPPQEKTFESHANSVAASEAPASGDAPLPSQEGREQPFIDLRTQDYSLPSKGSEAQQPQAALTPQPIATPAPTPVPTPQPTPVATATPEQFAMLTSTPPPPLRDPQEAEVTPTPQVGMTPPPPAARPMPERPASGYQPQKQQTKMTGRITNRGAAAVDAVGTPLGRYQKQVYDAIGARWYYYTSDRIDLVSIGTARIGAEVDKDGKVRNLRVLSNDSNEAFANVCLQSFQEAQIPPIPPDLVPTLPNGRLELEINFTIFPNR